MNQHNKNENLKEVIEMTNFKMIMSGETKISELSVAELFICYTGAKQYLEQEFKLNTTTVEMIHSNATKKGIAKTEDDFNDDSGFIFGKALSADRDGYHYITDNKNLSFYIPTTEDISQYEKHNNLIGKYLTIANECADKIQDGGYMEMFFNVEQGEFNL